MLQVRKDEGFGYGGKGAHFRDSKEEELTGQEQKVNACKDQDITESSGPV